MDELDIPDDWFIEHSGEIRVVDFKKVAELLRIVRELIRAENSAQRDSAIGDIEDMLVKHQRS